MPRRNPVKQATSKKVSNDGPYATILRERMPFFLMEDPLPEPAQTYLRMTSFSGKLIQFVTLPSATRHYTWPMVTIFFRK
jgi:hypothetical protein